MSVPSPGPRPRPPGGGGVLPHPRPAGDDVVQPADASRRVARVYADGSALSRYLVGAPCREQWLAWTAEHESQLVTTPLGLTELRRVAQPRGVDASGVAHEVEERLEVIRFSDQTLRAATKVSGVLPPFVALHIGAALAHPDVSSVATYDVQLAQVSALHGLAVVSPGWPSAWWEREG
ncbi:hypothetical protein [Cellulomonas sp. Leaf334]|uniref:hypothetical protein n=1 Tax=Cellulomonas sp. Leaf334 TaxID=1736339 RepID=UPI001F3ABD7F|nr:hypothetical protein [Cellulomonas sp. Leaf334]